MLSRNKKTRLKIHLFNVITQPGFEYGVIFR